jgi:hypothetical protein
MRPESPHKKKLWNSNFNNLILNNKIKKKTKSISKKDPKQKKKKQRENGD